MMKIIITTMWIFGIGVINFEEHLTNKCYQIYSAIIFCVHLFSPILVTIYSNLHVNFYENKLIRVSFWMQYYTKIIHILVLFILLWRNRLSILNMHQHLNALEKSCRKYKKPLVTYKSVTICTLGVVLLTAPLLISFDLVFGGQNVDFFMEWCCFVPGISINVYIVYMCYVKRRISALFRVLNEYLAEFCSNISWKDKIFNRNNTEKIYDKVVMTPELLHDFFKMRHKIFALTVQLNEIFNYEYLLYTFCALHGFILICYTVVLDLIRVKIKQEITPREHYSSEYWTLIYIIGMLCIVLAAHELSDTGKELSETLHKLRSVCNNINEQASLYTFQLIFMEVKINGARFFEINYSTLMGILGITIKYVFILFQFDVGLNMP